MLDREHVTDAIKFWERGRLFYNLALVALVLTLLLLGGADMLAWLSLAIPLFLLAVGANVLYCAAYPVDLLMQASDFRDVWREARWALLVLGILVASTLAYLVLGGPYIFGWPGVGPHG